MLISTITLGVSDLDRSQRFYAQGLGFPTRRAQHGVVYVGDSGTVLALYPLGALQAYTHTELSTDRRPPPVTVSHNVSSAAEVDTICAAAVAAGAELTLPPGQVLWGGYIAWFKDPDGLLWEVVFNPKYEPHSCL